VVTTIGVGVTPGGCGWGGACGGGGGGGACGWGGGGGGGAGWITAWTQRATT
jgi:hypothetical protein